MWENLAIHLLRGQDNAGSSPAIQTIWSDTQVGQLPTTKVIVYNEVVSLCTKVDAEPKIFLRGLLISLSVSSTTLS